MEITVSSTPLCSGPWLSWYWYHVCKLDLELSLHRLLLCAQFLQYNLCSMHGDSCFLFTETLLTALFYLSSVIVRVKSGSWKPFHHHIHVGWSSVPSRFSQALIMWMFGIFTWQAQSLWSKSKRFWLINYKKNRLRSSQLTKNSLIDHYTNQRDLGWDQMLANNTISWVHVLQSSVFSGS